MFDAKESMHMCTDWDALISSLAFHHVAREEIERLENRFLKAAN